ncbi:hypothetical protein PTSG_09316 [Salpingoeca rosetta]|uniref:PDZ domain-containing protein n=1 Tax=Salpingoeca rosetta (strain ATCC 50818 / BSB-021) TaxID=946362 RepID=F2UMA2_SALR5|nr:uncharacterized protein PTSG_09316 [Salpingoeca rosetta]EGD78251.1 hypothetical protein PTSG_09316 [Salpingoeca rosetta]|eukprot:XP_004989574.1 hypothetical protein PTSG_09316 [Salpingoeca rosetta]
MQASPPTRSQHVAEFQEMAQHYLNDHEKVQLQHALTEFKHSKSVPRLVATLNIVLDTPQKRDLLRPLRFLIPDDFALRSAFDKMAPYEHMAHPISKQELESLGVSRPLSIQRHQHESFGMNIRGGYDMGTGVFVSSVDADSPSGRAGLRIGDEILSANGISFQGITHARAVEIIKTTTILRLVVRYTGHVPAKYVARSTFNWVDGKGQALATSLGAPMGGRSSPSLPTDEGERRVLLQKSTGPLGFSIRGGSDFDLPVFISSVDRHGQAESAGLMPGHQILSINDEDVTAFRHEEVIDLIRRSDDLLMVVKYRGRVPTHRIDVDDVKFVPAEEVEREQQEATKHKHRVAEPPVVGAASKMAMEAAVVDVLGADVGQPVANAVRSYLHGRLPLKDMARYLLAQLSDPHHFRVLATIRPLLKPFDVSVFNALVSTQELQAKQHLIAQHAKEEEEQKKAQRGDQAWPDYGDTGTLRIDISKSDSSRRLGLVVQGGEPITHVDAHARGASAQKALQFGGIVIRDVRADGCARAAGVRAGMLLLRVENHSTRGLRHEEAVAMVAQAWRHDASTALTLLVTETPKFSFDPWVPPSLPLTDREDNILASTHL